jgi:Phage XkdN-like tail assembly chaperone protein, TAC
MAERDISFFLAGNAKPVEEEEVIVSKRYVDKEGKVIPFIMKPMKTEDIEELEKSCMKPVMKNGKKVGERLDTSRFYARMAIESTVFPDFKSEEMRKSYKTEDPVEVAKRVLSIGGEYSAWIEAALRINGFDDEFDDLVEEAKN